MEERRSGSSAPEWEPLDPPEEATPAKSPAAPLAAPLAEPLNEEDGDPHGDGAPLRPGAGYYFYGVLRSRGWRPGRAAGLDRGDLSRIRYRDLEALVRPVPYELPDIDHEHIVEHQRVVESAMRRGTILPAPAGIIFKGRRPLVRFLEDQYLVLDEGLGLLEGNWELRLHMYAADAGEPSAQLVELATGIYTELRRFARAAVPFRRDAGSLFSAAFLVDRGTWLEFVERTHDLDAAHDELTFDVTGPWPPYDFVRLAI